MDELAQYAKRLPAMEAGLKKVALLADYLRGLNDDDLGLAVQFLSAGPAAEGAGNHSLFEVEEKAQAFYRLTVFCAARCRQQPDGTAKR